MSAKLRKLNDRFETVTLQLEKVENQRDDAYNNMIEFETFSKQYNKFERLMEKAEDKIYDLEDKQGEIQEKIEELENAISS